MYSDNSMSQQSGKQPTLDAKIDLNDDRTKRTYFVTKDELKYNQKCIGCKFYDNISLIVVPNHFFYKP